MQERQRLFFTYEQVEKMVIKEITPPGEPNKIVCREKFKEFLKSG